jgi:excisionase family DNA binding protein
MPNCEIPTIPLSEQRAFTIGETAALVRLSIATLYNEMRRGRLQTIKIGGRRLVTRQALDDFLGLSDCRLAK